MIDHYYTVTWNDKVWMNIIARNLKEARKRFPIGKVSSRMGQQRRVVSVEPVKSYQVS